MRIRSTLFDLTSAGGLGNVVGQRARGGVRYLRARTRPANPKTDRQSVIRNTIAALAGLWRDTLTPAQRAAWDAYAAAVKDNGLSVTGANWYIACNSIRAQSNLEDPGTPLVTERIDAAPTTLSLASLSPVTVASFPDASHISVAFNAGDVWASDDTANAALIAWASPAISPSRKNNDLGYQYADHVRSLLGASPISSPRTLSLPHSIAIGRKVWLRFRCTNPDGRLSPVQQLSVTRTA